MRIAERAPESNAAVTEGPLVVREAFVTVGLVSVGKLLAETRERLPVA